MKSARGSRQRADSSVEPRVGQFMTVSEVAQLLHFNEFTVYAWIAAKKIPVVRVGRQLRIESTALARWVAKRREAAS